MTPASGSGAGLWSQTGSMAEIRFRHTLTLLPDGTVLVAGGGDGFPLALTQLYNPDPDPAAGAWSSTGSMLEPRWDHTATLLSDGRVLVTGGNGLASAELYDPITGTWSPAGSMDVAQGSHTATLLSDGSGRVLVIGGASAELYNPLTETWSSAGSMAVARSGHTATLLPSGKVLVAGGGYGRENELASAELYNPGTNSWSPTGSMAERRGTHTAMLVTTAEDKVKVKVLVVGGLNTVKKGRNWKTNYLASAELYDPVAETWSSTGGMATARFLPTATALDDGKVLIAGGWDGETELTNGELYDPIAETWSPTSSMVVPRSYHSATLLSDGRVLVAGGYGRVNELASAEVYDPAPDPQTGTLTGTVIEFDKRSPIKGVTVTIRETGQSAKTDHNGIYTIPDVRVGDVTVIAKKRSYGGQGKLATITDGGTTVVNFELVH